MNSPSERAPIELVRSCDEEQTSAKLLQNNDPLAFVNSSQDNGDSSWSQGGSHSSDMFGEEVNRCSLWCGILGGVVVGQLLHADHTGLTILSSSNLLLNKDWLLGRSSLLCDFLGELIDGLLAVGGRLTKPVDPTF